MLRIIVEIKFIPLHLKLSSIFVLPANWAETWTIGFKCGINAWIENSHIDPSKSKQSHAFSGFVVDKASMTSNTRGTDCE